MRSSPSSSVGQSRSPQASQRSSPSRIAHRHQVRSDQSILAARVVVAEGSEFVLEPLPVRTSPLPSASPTGQHRRISAPNPQSYSSRPPPFAPLPPISNSSAPPRARQVDRPYRPPPSSSARFYERQQQRWLLQHTDPPPNTLEKYSALSSIPPLLASPPLSTSRPFSATTSLVHAHPASPSHCFLLDAEQHNLAARSRSGSNASPVLRSRANSVSSLAPPATTLRARSGSAGSFTRSRISNGYMSNDDDETVENQPLQLMSAVHQDANEQQARPRSASFLPTPSDHDPLPACKKQSPESTFVDTTLGDSGDADWDAELGISETDHAEPLRLPLLPSAEHVLQSSRIRMSDSILTAPTAVVASNITKDSSNPQSCLQSINAADLRGIRVTSAVSENWDDDFLFQIDQEPIDSEPHNSYTGQSQVASDHPNSERDSAERLLQSHADQMAASEDDVENWDDAFSWNAESIFTPSASTSSSLYDFMQRSDANDRLSLGNTTYAKSALSPELPQTFSRQADSAKGHVLTSQKNNLPTVSSMTYAAGISARLAAQSDGESHQARLLQDSADHSAPRYPESKQYSALSRDRGMRSKTRVVNCRTDDSGDETETEIPSKEALASALTRPARRSLGSALGFDVRRKSVAKDAAVGKASPVCVETQNKDNVDSTQAKSHTRSQSKSKVGALQRFSFSRSRLNVANVSSTSINEMQQAEESPQRPYVNDANKSQASLLSHASTSSSTSRHGSTPTSLERSYNMLRSTSFRRLLGRSEKNSGVAIPRTTVDQASTLRRGSDPFHPMLPVSSPPRDKVSAHAVNQVMSSTSVRNTFRRSIEVTPTRPKNQSGRRGSDGSQLDLLEQALFDRSSSSITSPTFVRRARQQSDASKPTNQQPCEGCNPPAARPSLPLDYSGIRPSPTSGLRRDLSSSNTLRAGLSFAPGNATKPSVAISARQWNASKDTYAPAHSDAASTDGSAALYPYNGEKTMRGPGGHSSASRSVSASTAHSHTSVESLYGYRMRKQISTSSGADAPDSETSYGTSNGSSPRFVRQRSSTSNCYADVGSAIDTKETAWLASVDLSGQQESSKRHEIHHGRASSMPGSPLALENTLDGTPAVPLLRTTRKDLAPDTSLSPSQMTKQMQVVSVPPGVLDATYQQAPPSTTDPGVFLAKELSMDTSAPSLASSSQAMAPSAASISSRRTAARRNSLGDLKIPSRISKAQTGIRNNMNLVRDFAKGIEELKVLKASYMDYKMNTPRITSNAGESVQNWLECADVLIGLGEGRSESDATARVDTLTHTPLSEHVDGRCITFSDASANVGPTSPLDHLANRQMLTSGTRSTSGMSQRTTSTMDSGRSVDVHREIDILSVILGGQMLTAASHSGSRSHARYQAEAYTREDLPRQNNTYPVPSSQGHSIASMADESKLATPNGETFGGKRNSADDRASTSERPVKTAPGLSSSSNPSLGDVSELNRDDVGDVNRSAKRRLRSASRAGLQGLRELLKVFKGTPVEDSGAAMSKGSGLTEIEPARDDAKDQPRYSIDGGPLTPTTSRPKRKSITLKRRSFLRSKTSLESVSAKAADMQVPPEATPPLPLSADVGWYSQPSASQKDKRKPEMSPAKSSLDMTWEAGSADRSTQGFEPRRPATASSKAVRRISFQSVLGGNGAKRQSKDVALVSEPSPKRSNTLQQHVTQVKSTQHERSHSVVQHGSSLQHARPSLVTGTCEVSRIASLDPRRVSTSVDTLHRQDQLQLQLASPAGASHTAQVRAHSSTEGTAPQPPMIQKLALRPEAMPGLLVYVMATKQHLQAAIDEMAPSSRRDVLL